MAHKHRVRHEFITGNKPASRGQTSAIKISPQPFPKAQSTNNF